MADSSKPLVVELAVVIALGTGATCAAIATSIASREPPGNAHGWAVWSGVFFAVAVLVPLLVYGLHPLLATLDARATRRLAKARAMKTAARADAPPEPVLQPHAADQPKAVQILEAHYGAQGKHNDVTDVVLKHVNDGRLKIKVNNVVLGPDPIVDVVKHLWVKYRFGKNGEEQTIEFPESNPDDPDEPWATLP